MDIDNVGFGMIGKSISHYTILAKLGEGGMGIVYKAKDIHLDRTVAIKFLSKQLSLDKEAKQRFIQEAKITSALDHPNICTIYEVDETENGQLFIVMAYYEGKSLKQLIGQSALPVEMSLKIASQILRGLLKAHSLGIIHCDLNPSNIFITQDGLVKILDFGLAKYKSQVKSSSMNYLMGTLGYISPEQALGQDLDQSSDLWSFGVILYEMLSGSLPFPGEYEQAIIYSIMNEEPEPISKLDCEYSADLCKLLNKALTKNQKNRYSKVNEINHDLSLILSKLSKNKKSTEKSSSIGSKSYRIAVLPFQNIGGSPKDDYFIDGMLEELISTISQIDQIRVIARASVMPYKQVKKSIQQIGQELNVAYIIDGGIRLSENSTRISIQLIQVEHEAQIWSQNYDRKLEQVIDVQIDIAQKVAQALKTKLKIDKREQLEKIASQNLQAFQLYLKGKYHWNQRTKEGLIKSIDYFQKAIELDPTYALAYAGIADSNIILGDYGYLIPAKAYPKAEIAAYKAIELNNNLAQAHAALGCIKSIYSWDWIMAEYEFKKAIEINPAYVTAHHWYAINFLTPFGKFEEALNEITQANELDPKSLIINTTMGLIHYFSGQYQMAEKYLNETLDSDANFSIARLFLSWVYEAQGNYKLSISLLKETSNFFDDPTIILAEMANIFASMGEKQEVIKILFKLERPSEIAKLSPYSMYSVAAVYSKMRIKNKTIQMLNRAYAERCYRLIYLKVDPKFETMRSDADFISLMKKIGLD